jgi:antitoxin VapB
MALNIKNPEVVQLAAEVACMADETKTEAVRQALIERKVRLLASGAHLNRKESLLEYMAREVWPHMPPTNWERPSPAKKRMKSWDSARTEFSAQQGIVRSIWPVRLYKSENTVP